MWLKGEDVPSCAKKILYIIKGSTIKKAVRYSWWSPEESAKECDVKDSEVFSFTEGPLLIYLASGEVVGISSDESKSSVVVWLERDLAGNVHEENIEGNREFFPVENNDKIYCSGVWRSVSGKSVREIFIIKRAPQSVSYNDLPNEVGLKLIMSDGCELVLCHQLFAKSSNFSVSDGGALGSDVLGELSYLRV
ncbi:hypothetical protein [Metapseudomonas otitidis]|uniref:hypothetical protein n=1 Tax=Metapseudomonas otitidis TaxID=319939 RepID=UPI0013E0C02C|nr:hypothetical protein [Pseudomonas otitidis]